MQLNDKQAGRRCDKKAWHAPTTFRHLGSSIDCSPRMNPGEPDSTCTQ